MRWFLSLMLILSLLLVGYGANLANADGNNGTVKIVNATGDYDLDKDNDPHVCNFYIAGFGFDSGQTGTYSIVGHPPTETASGTSGSWRANTSGDWATVNIRLSDGHYKLTVDTGKGAGKHKVFWVECDKSDATPKPTDKPTPVPTVRPTEKPDETPRPTSVPSTAPSNLPSVPNSTPSQNPVVPAVTQNPVPVNSLPSTSTN